MEREKLVTEIANRIRNSLDLQEILDTCVAEVRSFLDCDRMLIYQFQPDWSGIIIAESIKLGWTAALGNQIKDFCFHKKVTDQYCRDRPIIVNNIYTAGYTPCYLQQLEQYQVKANLVFPIYVAGELWGLSIAHQCDDYRDWRPEDMTLLQHISVQLAIAIQQAIAYQQVQNELAERQRAEILIQQQLAELTAWRNRYEAAERASGQMLYEYDFVKDVIVWGANAELILGYSWSLLPMNLTGWVALIHPDDQTHFYQIMQQCEIDKTPFWGQYRVQHQAGHFIWVEDRNQWLLNSQGEGIRVVGMIADISERTRLDAERKQVEEALRESEAHHRALIRAIPDLFMRVNRAGIYLEFASIPNQHRVVGDPTEMQGNHVSITLSPELAQRRMEFVERALQTQSLQVYEQDLSTEGNIHIEEVRVFPYNENEVLLMARDISDRRQSEIELANSEARFQKIAAALPGILYIYVEKADGSAEFTYASSMTSAILEIEAEEVLKDARLVLAQFHPDDLAGYTAAVKQSAETLQPFHYEWRIITPSGKTKWLQANGRPERLDGQTVRWLGVALDVTDRKQAELALKVQRDFNQLIAEITSRFVDVSIDNLDLEIDRTLQLVAEITQTDTSYLIIFDEDARTMSMSHEWSKPNYPRQIDLVQNIPIAAFPWALGLICQRLPCYVPDIANLPAEAAIDRASWEQFNLKSVLFVPLLKQSNVVGFIGFASFDRSLVCEEENIRLLLVLGQTIANAQAQVQAEQELQQLNQILEAKVEERTQELQQLNSLQRAILDSTDYAIMSTDLTGIIQTFNASAERMLGYTKEEIVGKVTPDIFSDSQEIAARAITLSTELGRDIASGFDVLTAKALQGIVSEDEWTHIRKDGSCFPASLSVTALKDSDGQIIGFLAVGKDITDRKQAEANLQALSNRLQLALKAGSIGTWEWFLKDEILWDERIYEIFGLQDLNRPPTYQDWRALVDPDDLDEIDRTLREVLAGKQEFDMEFCFRRPDGEKRWVRSTALAQFDRQGALIKMTGMNQDITDRKQAETQLRQQAREKQLLFTITRAIRQSLDTENILNVAVHEVRQLLELDRVAVYRFQPDWNGEFITEAVADGWVKLVGDDINKVWEDTYLQNMQGGRFRSHETTIVNDIHQADLQTCHIELLEQFQAKAYAIAPIFVGEALWGLFAMYQNSEPYAWATWEVELLQQTANQLGIAIQQANLYQQVQSELIVRQNAETIISQQLYQQQMLGAIVQKIRESLDIKDILATVTQQVKDLLHADRVIVFRLFPDGKSQIVEESVSDGLPALKSRHWEDEVWSQEILDCYWQSRPRIVPDVMNDIWTDCLVEYSNEGKIQSKIVAPILQDAHSSETHRWVAPSESNKLWGVLVVHACQEKRVWQESEAQLLQQIANQLAIAIQQANLFEQLQHELIERQQAQQKLTETNQELARSNQELARATRLKDEFLANMSHELRTPLNAILGITEGLQDEVFGFLNEQQKQILGTVERSGNHLLELINDILDLAKIESGKVTLDCAATNIKHLCQASLVFIKQQAMQKQLKLQERIAPVLPDLIVDERRIRQVLINLLNNAVKFTPEGGSITLEVTLEKEVDETGNHLHWVRFAIIDTGIGIRAEDLQKLFQPFIQVDSALNRKYEGTGLGLSLVKGIVELHGGQVRVTSEVGKGSCFAIELPCSESIAQMPKEMTSKGYESIAPSGNAENIRKMDTPPLILMVEDNEANIITVSGYLQAKGYRVVLARNGEDGIALVQSEKPDLVLMDIQMPGIDGLEAIAWIRSNYSKELPIIALTALAMVGDREKCLEVGANDYLSKPIKLKQLATAIQQILER